MKKKILLISSVVVLFLSLPFMMGNGETQVKNDKTQLQGEIDGYKNQAAITAEKIESSKAKLAELREKLETIKSVTSLKKAGLINPPSGLEGVKTELEKVNRELDELIFSTNRLSEDYEKYSESKGPGYFESDESLREWLDSWNKIAKPGIPTNTTEKINLARQQQMDALFAGFLINVNFFHDQKENKYEVTNTANIKGQPRSWETGSSDVKPNEDLGIRVLRNFQSVKELEDWMKAHLKPMDLIGVSENDIKKIGEEIHNAAAEDGFNVEITFDCSLEIVTVTNEYGTEEWHTVNTWKGYGNATAGGQDCRWRIGKNELTVSAY